MKTVTMNPSALTAITAWLTAKDAEKSWQEYRRKLEEQILDLHPGLLESLQRELDGGTALSVTAELGSLKVEVKRSLELDQARVNEVLARAPYLAGVVFKCSWSPVASRSLFAAMTADGEVAEQIKEAVSFKLAKPYFAVK